MGGLGGCDYCLALTVSIGAGDRVAVFQTVVRRLLAGVVARDSQQLQSHLTSSKIAL